MPPTLSDRVWPGLAGLLAVSLLPLWFGTFACCGPGLSASPITSRSGASIRRPLDAHDWEFETRLTSGYVDRGLNEYAARAAQQGRRYASAVGALAAMPSLTWFAPLQGLSINLALVVPLEARGDVDSDGRIQERPGAENLLISRGGLIEHLTAGTPLQSLDPPAGSTGPIERLATGNIAGLHKEPNGLRRTDELDLTVEYAYPAKSGTVRVGLALAYTPNVANDTPARNATTATEFYVGYVAPLPGELSFETIGESETGNIYIRVAYAYDIKLGPVTLRPKLAAGYGFQARLQAAQDVTFTGRATWGSFYLELGAAYRPNLAFAERALGEDLLADGSTPSRRAPLWLVGGSTVSDGRVANPALADGPLNDLRNEYLTRQVRSGGNPTYTFTPRQKLPRNLVWVAVGHILEW